MHSRSFQRLLSFVRARNRRFRRFCRRKANITRRPIASNGRPTCDTDTGPRRYSPRGGRRILPFAVGALTARSPRRVASFSFRLRFAVKVARQTSRRVASQHFPRRDVSFFLFVGLPTIRKDVAARLLGHPFSLNLKLGTPIRLRCESERWRENTSNFKPLLIRTMLGLGRLNYLFLSNRPSVRLCPSQT